jgi:hypothetical protein
LPLTGLEVPGSAGVPAGLQSGPEVQLWLGEVCVCAGETGAPPPPVVELELADVVCVTDVVVVVGLPFVAVDVAGEPVVVDWVVLDDLLCLCVAVVVDELLLDPPQAASATASTTTAAATMATRARVPEHGVRCMTRTGPVRAGLLQALARFAHE